MSGDKGKNVAIGVGIVVIIILILAIISSASKDTQNEVNSETVMQTVMSPSHPLNATYIIEGSEVHISDGKHEEEIPGSSASILTSIWGTPQNLDIEGNIQNFWAVTLNQDPGGSGNFYYIAGCVGGGQACLGTNAVLLGDRITMRSIEIESDGTVVVNYADRPEGSAMAENPSIAVTRLFVVVDDTLKEVMSN
ncbi:hypothetical protein ACFL2C_03755 [Patescibacteria group bacterium]